MIPAAKDAVWKALTDVPYLVSCVPGAGNVQETARDNYRCTINTKVSYISATFDMTVKITNKIEGQLLETVSEGKGLKGMGRLTQKQAISLKEISEKETEATYTSELTVTGPLATFGQKVISAKFNEMADKFAAAFMTRFKDKETVANGPQET